MNGPGIYVIEYTYPVPLPFTLYHFSFGKSNSILEPSYLPIQKEIEKNKRATNTIDAENKNGRTEQSEIMEEREREGGRDGLGYNETSRVLQKSQGEWRERESF